MTSVSTFFFIERNRYSFQRLGGDLADLQRQTGSGYKADSVQGYGSEVGRLLSARQTVATAKARAETARNLEPRLGLQDSSLGRLASAVGQVRAAVENARSANQGSGLREALDGAFQGAVSALSQKFGDTYVFGGERSDVPPLTVNNLQDLAGLSSVAEAFQNGQRPQTFDFGQGGATPIAPLASDVATDFFSLLREVNTFAQRNNPTAPLTSTDFDQLSYFLDRLSTTQDAVLQQQGANGILQNRTEDLALQEESKAVLFTGALGDVADADLADVAARISAVTTQFQASAQVFNQVRSLTLLNFLR